MASNFRNPSYTDLLQGFNDRIAALGQPFMLLRTEELFRAIAINVHPIDPRLDLGSDWRECCTLEARRDEIPQGMVSGDILQQTNPPWNTSVFQQFPLWKLIRREDNGANFTIKFWAVRIPAAEEQAAYDQLGVTAPSQDPEPTSGDAATVTPVTTGT